MRRWNASEKTILAFLVGAATINACNTQTRTVDAAYLKIAATEAMAHKAGVNRVTLDTQNSVGFRSYGRSTDTGDVSSRANYLTSRGDVVSEELGGRIHGQGLDLNLPQGLRMVWDEEGFYHIIEQGDRVGSLQATFSERDGQLHMEGEYCRPRTPCRNFGGVYDVDNRFTVTFAALPGGNAEQITGEMYNR